MRRPDLVDLAWFGVIAVSLKEILLGSTGGVVLLLTIIQVVPVKINPWSWIAKGIGRAFNAEVLKKLDDLRQVQNETREELDSHIKEDEKNRADEKRANILRFNNELIRNIPHTKEEFVEILADIDVYERYCKNHPEYENNRAVHAIANIGRVYDDRLKNHDFA